MCISVLVGCSQCVIDGYAEDLNILLDEMQYQPLSYAHGYLCSLRSSLGRYDSHCLSDSDLESTHRALFQEYTSLVDLFPVYDEQQVKDSIQSMIGLLGLVTPTPSEDEDDDDHECDEDEDETECYFDEFVAQRERATKAEQQVDSYKQELFRAHNRERALQKQLSQIKRQRIDEIRYLQNRKRKNRR
ncbi:hypothetical protein ACSTK8_24640 [Vibrio parahaemolyticus]